VIPFPSLAEAGHAEIDQIIAQRYRLLEKLGEGGMGSVWRAQHLNLGTLVAIKLMSPAVAAHPEGLARFRREAQAAASLQSPNIVSVFDFGVDGDTPYIAMELLRGESLAQRLAQKGALTLGDTATILMQVARAVGKAHDAGVVHRDLKPDNVFLVPGEEGEIAKVLDFGIAKRLDTLSSHTSGAATRTGTVMGTPYYMSPEQVSGKRELDHRADIWAFGVIGYECVTGKKPFYDDNLGALVLAICVEPLPVPSRVSSCSAAFDGWFARCVAREPSARFPTIRDAAKELVSLTPATVRNPSPALNWPAETPAANVAPVMSPTRVSSGPFVHSEISQPSVPMSVTVLPLPVQSRRGLLLGGLGALVVLGGVVVYAAWPGGNSHPANTAQQAAVSTLLPSSAAPVSALPTANSLPQPTAARPVVVPIVSASASATLAPTARVPGAAPRGRVGLAPPAARPQAPMPPTAQPRRRQGEWLGF
jgi:eukaryotic-like serine/threonine-protein kinase